MTVITFHYEGVDFRLASRLKTSRWIQSVIQAEKRTLSQLTYVFCTDEFLLAINREFLRHRTYTDIVTFDLSDVEHEISGEIYISIPRIQENAVKFNVKTDEELHRVMIHGVLHLIGYGDKTSTQKSQMRKKEDAYLSLR